MSDSDSFSLFCSWNKNGVSTSVGSKRLYKSEECIVSGQGRLNNIDTVFRIRTKFDRGRGGWMNHVICFII